MIGYRSQEAAAESSFPTHRTRLSMLFKTPPRSSLSLSRLPLRVAGVRIPISSFTASAKRRRAAPLPRKKRLPRSYTQLHHPNDLLNRHNQFRSFSHGIGLLKEKEKEKQKEEKEKPALTLSVSQAHLERGVTVAGVLEERISRTSKSFDNFLCARSSCGKVLSLSDKVPDSRSTLSFLTFDSTDPAGREAFWLSSAYLLGLALRSTFGESLKLVGAPALASQGTGGVGYSYEFLISDTSLERKGGSTHEEVLSLLESQASLPAPKLQEAELVKLQATLETLVTKGETFTIETIPKEKALELFSDNPFKLERIEAFAPTQEDSIRIVRIEDYLDLAPRLGSTALISSSKLLKAQKLTGWSTATWLPTIPSNLSLPTNQSLLRLRGISFPKPSALSSHLSSIVAAAASDHRTIGKAQSLFFTHDSSPGTPFVLPHGMRLARKVERVVRDLYDEFGYQEVQSPQLFKKGLWEKSGHWENYREDMFSAEGYEERDKREKTLKLDSGEKQRNCCDAHSVEGEKSGKKDDDSFGLKPMNCPGHCLMFAHQERSYRDLPIRFAEFSPLHRNESSGSLSGLTRVRRFHQDDAHVFCTPSQVGTEIERMLTMLSSAYQTFGFKSYELVLSTRPPKFVGEVTEWDKAEESLKQALDKLGSEWKLNEGDGAFYGPKIDIRLVDALGRKHQTATIQLDFQLPRRFDLKYALPSSTPSSEETSPSASEISSTHGRPVMIHRAILGSVERFMAILIENTSGKWPFWLSPRQAMILPVGNSVKILDHVERVKQILSRGKVSVGSGARPSHVFHVDVDKSGETLGRMVRNSQLARYNFILVVGEREAENGTVNVRTRDGESSKGEEGIEGDKPILKKDMGEWKVQQLRELFVKLDDHSCCN